MVFHICFSLSLTVCLSVCLSFHLSVVIGSFLDALKYLSSIFLLSSIVFVACLRLSICQCCYCHCWISQHCAEGHITGLKVVTVPTLHETDLVQLMKGDHKGTNAQTAEMKDDPAIVSVMKEAPIDTLSIPEVRRELEVEVGVGVGVGVHRQ